MPFCKNCGAELDENVNACPSCNQETKPTVDNKGKKQLNLNLSKKNKLILLSLFVILLLFLGGIKTYSYLTSPETFAKNLVKALNQNDFDEVYDYFIDIPEHITEEMIVTSLQEMNENKSMHFEIIPEGIERTQYLKEENIQLELEDKTKALIPILYTDKEKEKRYILTLVQNDEGKWKTNFFLPLYDITVYAQRGTKVFLDNKEIGTISTSKEMSIHSILEGNHKVELKFINDIVPPYQEEIYVDNHITTRSPYKSYPISINTMPTVEVRFDGLPVENKQGHIKIDDALEGEHKVDLTAKGLIEPLTTTITVDSKNRYFHLNNFTISQELQNQLYSLLTDFNDADKRFYLEKNPEYLRPYVTNKEFEKFDAESMFWKKTTYIDYTMEPIRAEIVSDNLVYFTVKENWHHKQEVIVDNYTFNANHDTKLEIRDMVVWKYEIVKEGDTWKINSSEDLDYLVEYLNKNGDWVEYKS